MDTTYISSQEKAGDTLLLSGGCAPYCRETLLFFWDSQLQTHSPGRAGSPSLPLILLSQLSSLQMHWKDGTQAEGAFGATQPRDNSPELLDKRLQVRREGP